MEITLMVMQAASDVKTAKDSLCLGNIHSIVDNIIISQIFITAKAYFTVETICLIGKCIHFMMQKG